MAPEAPATSHRHQSYIETSEPDWTAIAYDLGYSSQQHFITDFRTVLGVTPVQYEKSLAPVMR